jgi:hypothetical protein
MPSDMLIGLWNDFNIRRMEKINAQNYAAAMIHEREVATATKAKNYAAKNCCPFRFDDGTTIHLSQSVQQAAQALAESGDLPPACVTDLLGAKVITPFLVTDYD